MALKDPHKVSFFFLELRPRGATPDRFSNWAPDITPDLEEHESVPEMEVKLPKNTGTLKEWSFLVHLPTRLPWVLVHTY